MKHSTIFSPHSTQGRSLPLFSLRPAFRERAPSDEMASGGYDGDDTAAARHAVRAIANDAAEFVYGAQREADTAAANVDGVVEAILARLDELAMLVAVSRNEFAEHKDQIMPPMRRIAGRLREDYARIDGIGDRIRVLQEVVERMEDELQRAERAAASSGPGPNALKITEGFQQLQTSIRDQKATIASKMKGVKQQVAQSEGLQKIRDKGRGFFQQLKNKAKEKTSALAQRDKAAPS